MVRPIRKKRGRARWRIDCKSTLTQQMPRQRRRRPAGAYSKELLGAAEVGPLAEVSTLEDSDLLDNADGPMLTESPECEQVSQDCVLSLSSFNRLSNRPNNAVLSKVFENYLAKHIPAPERRLESQVDGATSGLSSGRVGWVVEDVSSVVIGYILEKGVGCNNILTYTMPRRLGMHNCTSRLVGAV